MDGTLIDSSEGIVSAVEDTINELNLTPLDRDFIKSCIGPPIGDSIGKKMGYPTETIEEFYEVFRPVYKKKYLFLAEVYSGVRELLSELKTANIRIGIATNKREDYTPLILEKLDLLRYCDTVCAMDMAGTKKKQDLIEDCMANLCVGKSETIMVGDTINDLTAAAKCDMVGIGVLYGFGFKTPEDIPEGHQCAATPQSVGELIFERT